MVRRAFDFCFTLLERACPWLFCLGLALTFVHHGWMCCRALPEWVDPAIHLVQRAPKYLCYLCLLSMLRRHPWYLVASVAVLWMLHLGWEHSGRGTLFNSALLILASRGCGQRRILWIFLCALVAQFLVAHIGYWCGIMGDLTKHRYGWAGHSWGTSSPNMWAAIVMVVTMLSLQLCRARRTVVIAGVCCLVAVVVLATTLSITTVLTLLALPVIYGLLVRWPHVACWAAALPWLGLAVSLALMWYYGPSLGETTFESRFSMGALAMERYGVSWMGQDCGHLDFSRAQELGVEAFCLDNLYLQLLFYFGLLPMALVLSYFSYTLCRIARSRDWLLLALSVCFVLTGMMEAYPLFATMNFALYAKTIDN